MYGGLQVFYLAYEFKQIDLSDDGLVRTCCQHRAVIAVPCGM